MFSLKPDALASALRIAVFTMAAAVTACGGFIKGAMDIATDEHEEQEKALESRLHQLAARQAELEADKTALTREERRLAVSIDQNGRELAALQGRLSSLRQEDPARGDAISEMERKVREITQNIAALERATRAMPGQPPAG